MLRRLARIVAALAVLNAAGALPAAASDLRASPPPVRAAGQLGAAMAHVRAERWAEAIAAAQAAGPVAVGIVEWHRLRAGAGDPRAVLDFAAVHPDWPGIPWLFRQAEDALFDAPPALVRAFFADHPPVTTAGAMALLAALHAEGASDEARALAIRIWLGFNLSPAEQVALLARHGSALTPLNNQRLDALLWRGARAQVAQLLPLMDEGYAALAEARLALQAQASGVNALIAAVPEALQDDPGLAHDRFQWRMNAQNHDSAAELLLERSTSAEGLGRPEAWARWRAFLVRRALREGDAQLAYRLAAGHHLDDGAQFADLEWLAGFIALRHLDDAAAALRHFQRLRVRVASPISLGRAGYWEGRAHAALGDAESARAAFAFGAEHQTSFYGMLAAEAAGLPMDPALAGTEVFPPWQQAAFRDRPVLQAALMLREAGEWHLARRFVLHLAEELDAVALGQLGDMALALDEPNWAVNIAKQAVQREIVLPRAYFPITALAGMDLPAPTDLVLAIARRESEFDPAVVSPADARGLMQVLPGTARMMAERLDIAFDEPALTRDGPYNARLGAAYLDVLREEFGNSIVLVAAGYNAGPGRPRRWVQELGDPRDPAVDPIDWIESIPFAETRNYVMRVMESVWVYRARLAGGPVELTPTADLRAHQVPRPSDAPATR